jgi:aspartate/methionine/tyrosine aminotransferase
LRHEGIPVIDFSAGRAHETTPEYIIERAIQALRDGDTHQTMAMGTPEYRQACALKLARDNGIEADPEAEIIATMGVKQGLTLALMAIVNPGQEVIVEDPCFVSYQPLIRLCEGKPVSVPLKAANAFRWDKTDLQRAISPRTCAILLNSPQNPTGTVHTEQDLDMIASVARAHDLFVITDEIYERATWGGRRHVCMATRPGMRERTITTMGLTKTFSMGGWRIGFVYASAQTIAAMMKLQQHLLTCVGSFVQAGAAKAYGEPPHPEVLALWSDWEKRCAYVTSEFNKIDRVSCHHPEGGFYAWADVSKIGVASEQIVEKLLREQHVAVIPGSAFGPSGVGYLRVTCVKSWEDLRDGMQRIYQGLSHM